MKKMLPAWLLTALLLGLSTGKFNHNALYDPRHVICLSMFFSMAEPPIHILLSYVIDHRAIQSECIVRHKLIAIQVQLYRIFPGHVA